MYIIEVYEDNKGKSEVREYIQFLSNKRNLSKENKIKFPKITSYLNLLSEYGTGLREPYTKHIVGDIWELRPLRDRIMYAYINKNKILLLSVFMKQTEKTPRREIDKAKRMLEDYKNRSGENE